VIIDGAHNVGKMRSTANALKEFLKIKKSGRVHLLIGIAADKDIKGILKQIIPLADIITTCAFASAIKACTPPEKLRQLASKYVKKSSNIRVFSKSKPALDWVLQRALPSDSILITGSFYLAGDVRDHWVTEEFILKHGISFKPSR